MTGTSAGSAVTYGQLMNRALLGFCELLASPAPLAGLEEAVTAAQARCRIYRAVARASGVCASWLGLGTTVPAARLSAAERRAAATLHAHVNAAAAATGPALDLPAGSPRRHGPAARLAQVAADAGLAWDLLAVQLTPDGHPRARGHGWLDGAGGRAVLADAVLLARGMSRLDVVLEAGMWAAVLDPATPAPTAGVLRRVAEDCQAMTRTAAAAMFSPAALYRLAEPVTVATWHQVDTVAPPSAAPTRVSTQDDAVAAVDGYLAWLDHNSAELSVPDLTGLAVTGAKLASLVGSGHPAQDAAATWRRVHQALRPLRTIHPPPADYALRQRLVSWIDRQLDRQQAGRRPLRPQVTAALASHLPQLAAAGVRPLRRLHASGQLLGPVGTRGRYLYQPASDAAVLYAEDAFTTAAAASARLAENLTPPAAPRPAADPTTPARQASAGDNIRVGTPTGHWELAWDQPRATFSARHRDHDHPPADAADHIADGTWLGNDTGALPTVAALEQRLGFALPALVSRHLATDQQTRPGPTSRVFHLLDTARMPTTTQVHPTPASPVHVPGHPDRTYRQALAEDPPIRTWARDGYRIDILTADPVTDPHTGDPRHAITYRLSHHGRVIFAGEDIDCPADQDPASDTAIRRVATRLTTPTQRPVTRTQRDFLRAHTDTLTALLTPPQPPYPPGTRIAVTTPGQPATTGTVIEAIPAADGGALAYAWRPDTAELPGHPWHSQPQHTLIAAADHVTHTLTAPDTGLTDWTPQQPLAYHARVIVTDNHGHHHLGVVLRAIQTRDGLAYDIDASHTQQPSRVPATHIDPIAGTAWPSINHLLQARTADRLQLRPGEILTAAGHTAYLTTEPDSPTLNQPAATSPAIPPSPEPTPPEPEASL